MIPHPVNPDPMNPYPHSGFRRLTVQPQQSLEMLEALKTVFRTLQSINEVQTRQREEATKIKEMLQLLASPLTTVGQGGVLGQNQGGHNLFYK